MEDQPFELPEGGLSDGVVTLRLPQAADAAALARGVRDPDIVRFAAVAWGEDPVEVLAEKIATVWPEAAAEGRLFHLVIAGPDGEAIGYLIIFAVNHRHGRCEVGFVLFPEARGRGATARAVELACRWAFAAGLRTRPGDDERREPRVAANARERRFTREGVLRGYMPLDGTTREDFELYARLATD